MSFEIVNKREKESSIDDNLVLLNSRDLKRGQDELFRLDSLPKVHLFQLDISLEESIARVADRIRFHYDGRLDVVINNAAAGELELIADAARTMFATMYYSVKTLN